MSLSERRNSGETLANRYSAIGAIFILLYSVMSAAKEVAIGHVVQNIDPNLLVFLSFGFVILIFNADVIWNFPSFAKGWQIFFNNFREIALLNLETALAWGCFFWAVRYLEPAVVSAVTVGISPFFSQLFGIERDNNRNVVIRVFFSSITSLFLLIATYLGFSAMGEVSLGTFLVGTLLCGLGGAAIALVTSRSRRLYKRGYNPFDLMRTRFVLLVCISGLATFIFDEFGAEPRTFSLAGIIAIFGISIPLLSLQKGLERCGSTTALLIISCAPGFTWLFQLFDPRLHYSTSTVVAIGALFLIACWSIVSEQKQPS
uniref:hypothetical protein n=1 Tax=Yersinia frederiksenii TaxID=29484 RepID=UPI001F4C004C|nr:hypothetical protein [Yersinia frederiksenii]ULG19789.1 hypothetical protein 49p1_00071 [Yersinia frederiksenii]